MPSLKALRKRIATVRSTQQITKAMKMVAAAKLRRAQEAAERARPYAAKLSEMFTAGGARVAAGGPPPPPPRPRPNTDPPLSATAPGACGGDHTNQLPLLGWLLAAGRRARGGA